MEKTRVMQCFSLVLVKSFNVGLLSVAAPSPLLLLFPLLPEQPLT